MFKLARTIMPKNRASVGQTTTRGDKILQIHNTLEIVMSFSREG